jgi:hypothetical protein
MGALGGLSGPPAWRRHLRDSCRWFAVSYGRELHKDASLRASWCRRSSELFRQEFSVESFLNPPTLFHSTLVDVSVLGRKGESRFASACK